jgi:Ice-binding-like
VINGDANRPYIGTRLAEHFSKKVESHAAIAALTSDRALTALAWARVSQVGARLRSDCSCLTKERLMKKFSLIVLFAASAVSLPSAPTASVNLGSAGNFAVLANSTVTSTGPTVVTGDLGISPGTALAGFGPGVVIGTKHLNDPVAAAAQLDLTTAYNDAAGRALPAAIPADIGGTVIVPGLYKAPVSLAITGNVILNGAGVYIFQIPSTLTTASGSQIILAGGASASNIFWQVGSSATLGTTSIFYGNILAQASITVATGATLSGRALARTGAVTLDTNAVSRSGGVLPPITPVLVLPPAGPGTLPSLCLSSGFLPSGIDGNGFTHASGSASNPHLDQTRIDHVLLLSVDGMHALDLANYARHILLRILPNSPLRGSPMAMHPDLGLQTHSPACSR